MWHRKMCHAQGEKWKKTNNERKKARKNQNTLRKEKLQVPGHIGSGHIQISGDVRRLFQTNEKASKVYNAVLFNFIKTEILKSRNC